MAIVGVVMVTVIPIAAGQASVLFTFYPPLTASPWFYIGLVLVVAALMDLVRADARGDDGMEARKSRPAGAARDVRDRRQCRDVAVDDGRRRGRAGVSGHPGGASAWCRRSMSVLRARCSPGRCMRSSISG